MTAAATGLLILVRHGESEWNKSNRFTGWADVPLTTKGIDEARKAGTLLAQSKIRVDEVYTSVLDRSITSAEEALGTYAALSGRGGIPINKRLRLNERHYGALTGQNKKEAMASGGPELLRWRSTLDGRPPSMNASNSWHAPILASADASSLTLEGLDAVPLTESMRDCCERVLPLWRDELRPAILSEGKTLLVIGHANNLRALIRCVQGLDDEELSRLGVPNSLPLVYEFDTAGRPLPPQPTGGTVAPLSGSYLGEEAGLFETLNSNRDGTLSVDELAEAGLCDVLDESEQSCERLMEQADNNGDGRVDFNEFVNWMKRSTD